MSTTVSRHTLTDTRKLIMRTARELLLTRSYLGLSFQELADRVGIRKPSLYHHFASKELLGIALVEDSLARFHVWADSVAGQPAAQQMLAYISLCRDLVGAGQRVCPVGATGGEWDCIEPALQDAVRRFHRTQLDWLGSVAQRLQVHGDALATSPDAQQWAAQVSAICQGALVAARLHGDATMFDMAVAPLRASLLASG